MSRVAKNTAFLTAAFVGQKVLAFIYFTLIARIAGVTDTGAYVFALSYTTIFSVFIDFGLTPVLTRATAQDESRANEQLNTVLGIKLFSSAILAVFALIIVQFLNKSGTTLTMVYIATAVMLLDSFTLSFWGILRGLQRLKFESTAIVTSQVLVLIVGITGLLLGAPLPILIIALLVGSLFNFIFAAALMKRKLRFQLRPRLDRAHAKQVIAMAIPFGFTSVFTRTYSSLDSVLLSVMVDDQAVGWYSVPNKIVFALNFIPSAFAASIFPAMSALYVSNKERMVRVFEQSVFYLLLISLPSSVGLFVLARPVVIAVFGPEYEPSALALQILAASLIFTFINFPIGALLAAIGHQRKNAITLGVVLAANVILNLILIPKYSFIGSSIAALAAGSLLIVFGFFWVERVQPYNRKFLLVSFVKISIAAAIMGIVVWYLLSAVHFTLLVLVGAVVYAALLWFFRVLRREHIQTILGIWRKTSS